MTKKEVVITGMGCVSPYGVGVETLWDNVKNGNSGIRELKSVDITKHLVHIGRGCLFLIRKIMLTQKKQKT